jgi:hypothetical protein
MRIFLEIHRKRKSNNLKRLLGIMGILGVDFKIDHKEAVYENVDCIHPALRTGLNVGISGAG